MTSQANYSISEGLAIVPLTHQQFLTKHGQFNGCLHARLHENGLVTENPEKRQAYSSAFSSKIWHSRVICVLLRWGLTYIWHVLWGKLSFNKLQLPWQQPIRKQAFSRCHGLSHCNRDAIRATSLWNSAQILMLSVLPLPPVPACTFSDPTPMKPPTLYPSLTCSF